MTRRLSAQVVLTTLLLAGTATAAWNAARCVWDPEDSGANQCNRGSRRGTGSEAA